MTYSELFGYLQDIIKDIDFILKVHCGFTLEEMNNLKWDQVENYYKRWYDLDMNRKITDMALNGVEYNDPDKCKTTYFKDYIDESSKTSKKLSLKE